MSKTQKTLQKRLKPGESLTLITGERIENVGGFTARIQVITPVNQENLSETAKNK